jgi:hypothetical protein
MGPGCFIVVDPDGNPILLDRHVCGAIDPPGEQS